MATIRVADIRSVLTGEDVEILYSQFGIPKDIPYTIPGENDRACSPPEDFVTVYDIYFTNGLRIPIAPELFQMLKDFGVPIARFHPNAVRYFCTLCVFFRLRSLRFNSIAAKVIFRFVQSGDWISLSPREINLSVLIYESVKDWKDRFFFFKLSDGIPGGWGRVTDSFTGRVTPEDERLARPFVEILRDKATTFTDRVREGLLSEELLIFSEWVTGQEVVVVAPSPTMIRKRKTKTDGTKAKTVSSRRRRVASRSAEVNPSGPGPETSGLGNPISDLLSQTILEPELETDSGPELVPATSTEPLCVHEAVGQPVGQSGERGLQIEAEDVRAAEEALLPASSHTQAGPSTYQPTAEETAGVAGGEETSHQESPTFNPTASSFQPEDARDHPLTWSLAPGSTASLSRPTPAGRLPESTGAWISVTEAALRAGFLTDERMMDQLKIGLHQRKLWIRQLQDEISHLRLTRVDSDVLQQLQDQNSSLQAELQSVKEDLMLASQQNEELRSAKDALEQASHQVEDLRKENARLRSELRTCFRPEELGQVLNARCLDSVQLCKQVALVIDPLFPVNFFDERNRGVQSLSDLREPTDSGEPSSSHPGSSHG